MAPQQTDITEVDEGELVTRAQKDDSAAFRELFDRFYPMIYSFCYRACLDQSGAQDIAQETFIKAARALGTFRLGSSFKAWLYSVATNATRDWQRAKARQDRVSEMMAETPPERTPTDQPDHSRLVEALQTLPDDLRLAIVLVYYEGMNHATAARVLGCAETTVSWRVFRAKRKLKILLLRKEALK